MNWLISNSFLIIVLLVCIGMHIFGHGKHEDHNKDSERRK